MILSWAGHAWEYYLYWQQTDNKILKRIYSLIENIKRQPPEGMGSPESLKHNCSEYWSRRINREHRFVYKVLNESITIVQCRYHYQIVFKFEFLFQQI